MNHQLKKPCGPFYTQALLSLWGKYFRAGSRSIAKANGVLGSAVTDKLSFYLLGLRTSAPSIDNCGDWLAVAPQLLCKDAKRRWNFAKSNPAKLCAFAV
jgi:hypothetical protein